jgi:hypothetical protein
MPVEQGRSQKTPEALYLSYIEDAFESRTLLEVIFSVASWQCLHLH